MGAVALARILSLVVVEALQGGGVRGRNRDTDRDRTPPFNNIEKY